MRDLKKYADFCMSLLDNLDIPYTKPVSWEINNRAVKRFGQCRLRYGRYSINISAILLDEKSNEKDLFDTILHELIHTCPNCMNHGYEWKKWGEKVKRAYGYDISRTKKGEQETYQLARENRISKAKYVCVCSKCGHKFYYQRHTKVIDNPSHYHHTGCGGTLRLKLSECKEEFWSYQSWYDKNTVK